MARTIIKTASKKRSFFIKILYQKIRFRRKFHSRQCSTGGEYRQICALSGTLSLPPPDFLLYKLIYRFIKLGISLTTGRGPFFYFIFYLNIGFYTFGINPISLG